MTRNVGAVLFDDATRLYLIYDDAANLALRPLFQTESAARDWLASGMPMPPEPKQAKDSEEGVTLIMDIALEHDRALAAHIRFASRASRKAMWLTGPRSFLEMAYENGATASREF